MKHRSKELTTDPSHADPKDVRGMEAKIRTMAGFEKWIKPKDIKRDEKGLTWVQEPDGLQAWHVPMEFRVAVSQCSKCGRIRKLISDSSLCGTCHSRDERRTNCREMWGRGRRGY